MKYDTIISRSGSDGITIVRSVAARMNPSIFPLKYPAMTPNATPITRAMVAARKPIARDILVP